MKKILALIIILLMITVALSGCTDNEDDLEEDEEEDEYLNDPGGSGWIKEGICVENGWYWNPEIVRLNDNTYRMYIEDHGNDGSSFEGIAALSSSNGFEWSYEGLVLTAAAHPAIVQLPDGRWRLYYQNGQVISSAISDNGLTFEKEEGTRLSSDVDLEGANVRHPCVVALPDGGYRMYYDTDALNGGFIRIWSAYSEDGLTFTHEGVNIDLTSYRTDWPSGFYAHSSKPEVLQTPDGKWRMFFASTPLIGSVYQAHVIRMATSDDGLDWDIKTDNYEISAGKMPDGKYYGTYDVSVQLVESATETIVRMWYCLFLPPEDNFVGDYSGIYSASKSLGELDN